MQSNNTMKNRNGKLSFTMTRNLVAPILGRDKMDFVRQSLCTPVRTLIFTIITPNSSDSVNFWFCALSDSRSLVAIEMSCPDGHALNSLCADTSAGTEGSAEIDAGAELGLGWDRLSSPPEWQSRLLKRPENVWKSQVLSLIIETVVSMLTLEPYVAALRR